MSRWIAPACVAGLLLLLLALPVGAQTPTPVPTPTPDLTLHAVATEVRLWHVAAYTSTVQAVHYQRYTSFALSASVLLLVACLMALTVLIARGR